MSILNIYTYKLCVNIQSFLIILFNIIYNRNIRKIENIEKTLGKLDRENRICTGFPFRICKGFLFRICMDFLLRICMDFLLRIVLLKHYTSNPILHRVSDHNPSFFWKIGVDSNQIPEAPHYPNDVSSAYNVACHARGLF